ncbi:MAG: glutamate--cysteine ligase GshA [Gammaproteobacteria bacterium]|nr:glutamate--cysteine ligase GshA [Gammaproteobacteria bacterium]
MSTQPVPHLTTALSGPLHKVESHLQEHQPDIESWFRSQWRQTSAPFYASVDIRNAGFKIAPVDTNLFPAGFNNLNPAFQFLCIQSVQQAIERMNTKIDRILIIPENHSRNQFYFENLAALQEIVEKAGFEVRLGSTLLDLDKPMDIPLTSGGSLHLEPLVREGKHISVDGFTPELVILNNDLSSGRPALLEDLEQRITPPLQMGLSNRLKSDHFAHYQTVAEEFSSRIDIDPWLITPMFRNCGEIDFMKREGEACLSINVERLLKAIQEKYDKYDVKCQPFVMVKADTGTYGMGVMTIKSPDEISSLNRKQRTRMATIKEGQKVSKVLIQEGVYTYETWGDAGMVAEPVVYMIDHNVVGGFYRVHSTRLANENLNSPGMRFEPLAFDDCCISPEKTMAPDAHPNRFYAYGVIARLALLAAAREMIK